MEKGGEEAGFAGCGGGDDCATNVCHVIFEIQV